MKILNTQRIKLATRPTAYRKNKVRALEAEWLKNCEDNCISYQEKVFGTRNTNEISRHLKYINKVPRIPNNCKIQRRVSKHNPEQYQLLNSLFHSVFAPKAPFTVKRYQNQKAKLQNFKVSVGITENFLDELDIKKSRGPNNLPPIFFKATKKQMCRTLNTMFKNFKRIRKLPLFWTTAAVVPVYKKDSPKLVENYRPISLLCIDGRFSKSACTYRYTTTSKTLSTNQHGFFRKRSVMGNLLQFLNENYVTKENDPTAQVIEFYSDFSKTFETTNCSSSNYVTSKL